MYLLFPLTAAKAILPSTVKFLSLLDGLIFSGYNVDVCKYSNRDDGERPRRRFAQRAGDWCKSGEGARRGITSERQAERVSD